MPSSTNSAPGTPSARSAPRSPLPTYSRTVTQTSTQKVEKSGRYKSTTLTTNRTTTVLVRERCSSTGHQSGTGAPQPSDSSDNPDDDATIEFATDSDEDLPPSSPTPHSNGSQSSPCLSSQSMPERTGPGPADTSSDRLLTAYYEERYPGRVPQPKDLREPETKFPVYYVVSSGKSVGIFTDWNLVSDLVLGVSKARFRKYKQYVHAWAAYRYAWASMRVRVLQTHQDSAPLHTQVTDSGMDFSLGNIIL
ncbi:hypothetical protein PQX77_000844 [Marasmius sp. AFHP31]|nr:hypothetical protein PQX77_000844 [Marasmius sp. AFHP31]